MIWRFIKSFYYQLFCTHPIVTVEHFYRAERVHGYINITVLVCETCERCGREDVLTISKHSGTPGEMERIRKCLEEKGYRNVEDLA